MDQVLRTYGMVREVLAQGGGEGERLGDRRDGGRGLLTGARDLGSEAVRECGWRGLFTDDRDEGRTSWSRLDNRHTSEFAVAQAL